MMLSPNNPTEIENVSWTTESARYRQTAVIAWRRRRKFAVLRADRSERILARRLSSAPTRSTITMTSMPVPTLMRIIIIYYMGYTESYTFLMFKTSGKAGKV
jgi:hypothetical protein